MSYKVSISSPDFQNLLRRLSMLEKAAGKPILTRALRAAAEPIRDAAKAYAPKDTGQLEKSIKIKSARGEGDTVSVRVTTGAGDYLGDTFYGAFIEYGYKKGSRRLGDRRPQIAAQPYMGPAAEANKDRAIQIAAEVIRQELEKLAK